jgi:putative transposase
MIKQNTYEQGYPSSLKEQEWQIIKPLLPKPKKKGRPLSYSWREILDGILYVTRSGCAWRLMPENLPPWQSVYYHFRQWQKAGIWQKLNQALAEIVRCREGREVTPSAAIIDSQSVKRIAVKGLKGYDAGKKVIGRKRHITVDTLGLLLIVVVTSASVQDRDGAKLMCAHLKERYDLPHLQLIWADGGYRGKLIAWVKIWCQWLLKIVHRNPQQKGFQVLPRRWVVERTFGWLNNYRRLSKDYEETTDSSEAFIYTAMIHVMVRKLAGVNDFTR